MMKRQWLPVFPRNVWLLSITLALVMTAVPLMVLISGLLGARLAPVPELATLPLAFVVLGTAFFAFPAAMLMRRRGRRFGGFFALGCSLAGAGAGAVATETESFASLLLASVSMGAGMAFYQQFRFAAIESMPSAARAGSAVSLIMLSGIVSAFVGPELGIWGRQWPGLAEYTGAFVLLAGLVLVAALVFAGFKNPLPVHEESVEPARPLWRIVCQPVFLMALAAAAIGYGVMSFLMTSTPISMHNMHGHSLAEAKWVIQSHLVAMFLPSLFAGVLQQRIGSARLMLTGCGLYALVLIIALNGQAVLHYWWALVLLGVGWNFLFLAGTTLLPAAYRGAERFKTQAVNDFSIFAVQAVVSLLAGWVLYRYGWTLQVWLCVPVVVLLALASGWYATRQPVSQVSQSAG